MPFTALLRLAPSIAWVVATLFGCEAMAVDKVRFVKSPVKLIDTGLEDAEPNLSSSQAAFWVDNNRLIAALATKKSVDDPKQIGRTALFNIDTRKTTELMRYARPICWDAQTGKGGVVFFPDPANTRNKEILGIRVDLSGALIERNAGTSSSWWGPSCEMGGVEKPNLHKHRISLLRPEHGYIDLGVPSLKNDQPPVFIKPDGTRWNLPTDSDNGEPLYLPFLEKYQLNIGSSCNVQGKPCPPDIYLLDPLKGVTAIKIPRELMEIMPIQRVHVVKNGLLFRAESSEKREGYLLLRNGVLHELWRPGGSGFMNPQRTETWGHEVISPDGCKVAFRRGARPSRVYVFDLCSVPG